MSCKHAASDASTTRDDEWPTCFVEILKRWHSGKMSIIGMYFPMQEDVMIVRVVAKICVDGHHIDALTVLDPQRFFSESLPTCEVSRLVHVQPYA